MTLSHVVDGVTDLDSALFNPIIDRIEGLAAGTVPVALAGLTDATTSASIGPGGVVTVAPSGAPSAWRQAADFGADEIQDAVDQAQTYLSAGGALPGTAIRFLPGSYRLTEGIEIKSASWFCPGGAAAGAQFYWDGADNATFLTKPITYAGSSSWWEMNGLSIREGTGTPAELLHFEQFMDSHCYVHNCAFNGGKRQIVFQDGFTNLHWDHLRFDSWWEYAIYMTIPATQFLSNFVLDQFTFDSNELQSGGANAKAFMGIALTSGGADPGTIRLSNAKFEVNYNNTTSTGSVDDTHPNSVIHVIQNGISAQLPIIEFSNCNLTWDAGVTTYPPESWVYRDAAATGGIERVLLTNCESQDTSRKLLGGYQPAQTFGKQASLPSYISKASFGLSERYDAYNGTSIKRATYAQGSGTVVELGYVTSTATPTANYTRTLNGTVSAGADNSSPDTTWGRTAADQFGLGVGDSFKVDGTYNGGHLLLGSYHLWVDGSGNLRIKSSAPSSATDGTVIGTQT